MAGSMSRTDLVVDLKTSLHDAAGAFGQPGDADFDRLLAKACDALNTKRPRTLLGSLELVAGQPIYTLALPAMQQYKTHLWGARPLKPWSPGHPGALPRVTAARDLGQWTLVFDPAPTFAHLAVYGSTFRFWYFAAHQVAEDEAQTTVAAADRGLLLLRAQAEAMRELTLHHANKPVQVRDGYSGMPRNSTPAALFQQLLAEFESAR